MKLIVSLLAGIFLTLPVLAHDWYRDDYYGHRYYPRYEHGGRWEIRIGPRYYHHRHYWREYPGYGGYGGYGGDDEW
jgi:hypothetical protein